MPIYEYQCESCGHTTEMIQKISDPAATVCPHCQKESLKRLVSAAGFQLKGSGWYVTDFRNKETKPGKETKTEEKITQPTKTDDKSSSDK